MPVTEKNMSSQIFQTRLYVECTLHHVSQKRTYKEQEGSNTWVW
jgi:hypothetical protein